MTFVGKGCSSLLILPLWTHRCWAPKVLTNHRHYWPGMCSRSRSSVPATYREKGIRDCSPGESPSTPRSLAFHQLAAAGRHHLRGPLSHQPSPCHAHQKGPPMARGLRLDNPEVIWPLSSTLPLTQSFKRICSCKFHHPPFFFLVFGADMEGTNILQRPDMGDGEQGHQGWPDGSPEKHRLASMWNTMRQKLESEQRYRWPG